MIPGMNGFAWLNREYLVPHRVRNIISMTHTEASGAIGLHITVYKKGISSVGKSKEAFDVSIQKETSMAMKKTGLAFKRAST